MGTMEYDLAQTLLQKKRKRKK